MNQSEIITQIGGRIRTASRNFITSDEIKRELNRSLDRLSGKIDLVRTIQTVTINFTGDGSYTFSALGITDFKKPIQLFDRNSNQEYKRVNKTELYRSEDSGLFQYTITPTGIDIESGVASTSLSFQYYSVHNATDSTGATLQTGLSLTTDIPALQARFHDFFVEDVAAILFRKERKWEDVREARSDASLIFADIETDNITQKEFSYQTVQPYAESYD
jgi:hypothetical protein